MERKVCVNTYAQTEEGKRELKKLHADKKREANYLDRPIIGGYVGCGCRDCFEIAIATKNAPAGFALCSECEKHGCRSVGDCEQEGYPAGECCAPHAYEG